MGWNGRCVIGVGSKTSCYLHERGTCTRKLNWYGGLDCDNCAVFQITDNKLLQ